MLVVIAIPQKAGEAISLNVRLCDLAKNGRNNLNLIVSCREIASLRLNAKPCFVPRNDAESDDKN
jgi:hypothetical protein